MTGKKSLRPFIIYVKNTLRVQEEGTAALHNICFRIVMDSDKPEGGTTITRFEQRGVDDAPVTTSFAKC
jgi:hypothetical protein